MILSPWMTPDSTLILITNFSSPHTYFPTSKLLSQKLNWPLLCQCNRFKHITPVFAEHWYHCWMKSSYRPPVPICTRPWSKLSTMEFRILLRINSKRRLAQLGWQLRIIFETAWQAQMYNLQLHTLTRLQIPVKSIPNLRANGLCRHVFRKFQKGRRLNHLERLNHPERLNHL